MSDRILTTHVGSLPRPEDVTEVVFARERGETVEESRFDGVIGAGVERVMTRQREAGIDLPSDGEMSKISYATYIKDRLTGFEGDSPRRPPADLKAYPSFLEKLAKAGGTPSYKRPKCVGPIAVKDLQPLHDDIARMKAAMAKTGYAEGFMNSATPGVIALFQPSEHHASHEAYLEEVAEAMRQEYEAIVESGLLLQLDSPDLGLGRHMMFPDLSDEDFIKTAERHVEILNHALRNVPGERVRIHICWGNYEGPHHCDIALAKVLPTVLKAKPRALLFESSNPRHAHEWTVWEDTKLPEDYRLIPGVIDSTTNFVEHPELVAQRIERFAGLVGRDRVIAGTDCGFATFAGFGAVDGEIAWAKLAALAEGAAIATGRLWGRAA
ncbi:cobalamin-independent methionine synthase II family protein [Pelagibius sp.]|uniref:cobalamin-independent methionine synthase II family protein n=1 Tax=Pelagibius sp. TaxID=1931238 RepID=UPI002635A88F|nr:cobalamin-independent methionine synthase II family protein [Pelagibius sp.]